MRGINDLQKELSLLLNDFKSNKVSLNIALIKFERLIKDFKILSSEIVDENVVNKLFFDFKATVIKLEKIKLLQKEYENNLQFNSVIRTELGL